MNQRPFSIFAAICRRGLFAALLLCGAMHASAQISLAGHTYYNANIMAEELNKATKDIDKELAKARTEAITKFEKEKGRKPTEAEKAEIDDNLKEARAMFNALKTGLKTTITIEFKNEKDMVMKADMSISDDALKAAGVGWLKRKAMKAALAAAPSSQKGTYKIVGKSVIVDDGNEKDTLRLSDDGKYLFGKFEDTEFKLTRTK